MTFRFRPVLTIATLVALAILVSLGMWQLKRLQWKHDLIDKVEMRLLSEPIPFDEVLARAAAGEDMEYAPVMIKGAYTDETPTRVFGMLDGEPGYYLFQPLAPSAPQPTQATPVVYINRGFVPQASTAEEIEAAAGANVTIKGLFRTQEQMSPPAAWFRTTEMTSDGYWFVRDPIAFANNAGLTASPFYIDSFAVEDANWPKGGTTRLDFSNRHLEYALTWFGLAGALLGVFLFFSMRRD
jgi:surfeit locus 1 family protein